MFEHDKERKALGGEQGPSQGSQVKATLDGNEEFAETVEPRTTRGQ